MAAPSFRSAATAKEQASGTTLTSNNYTLTSGDSLFAIFECVSGSPSSVMWNGTEAMTLIASNTNQTSRRTYLYGIKNPSAVTSQVTATVSNTITAVSVFAYTAVDSTTPWGTAVTADSPNSTTPTVSVTGTSTNATVIMAGQEDGAIGGLTFSNGTKRDDQTTANCRFTIADRASSVASLQINATQSASFYVWEAVEIFGPATALVAGVASCTARGLTTASLSATANTGGTGTVTYQWKRKTIGGSYANVSGATSLTLNDTGLTSGTDYIYKITYTDSAGTPVSVDSNEIRTWTQVTDSSICPVIGATDCSTWGTGSIQANGVYPSALWLRWNSTGELMRFKATVGAAGIVSVILDTTDLNGMTAGDCPQLMWRWEKSTAESDWTEDTVLAYSASNVTKTLYSGLAAGTYTFHLWWKGCINTQQHWDFASACRSVKCVGIQVDVDATLATPTLPSKTCIWFGASLSEGDFNLGSSTSIASSNSSLSFPNAVGRIYDIRLARRNWGGQGWSNKGIGNVTPGTSNPSFYNATANKNSWNNFALSRSMLVSGTFPVAIDEIWIDQGYNDGGSVLSAADVTTALQAIRVAHPTTKIYVLSDYLGTNGNTAALSTGVTNAADNNIKFLQLTVQKLSVGTADWLSFDGSHPKAVNAVPIIVADVVKRRATADGGSGGAILFF